MIISVFVSFCCASLLANDTYLGGNGTDVFPMQNNDVQMVKEDLVIHKIPGGWKVEVKYLFRNSGKECVVQMGFPAKQYISRVEYGNAQMYDFTALVDGKKISTTTKKGRVSPMNKEMHFEEFYVFDVLFKEGQTRSIMHTYTHDETYTNFMQDVNLPNHEYLEYILVTGSMWKGKIEELNIAVNNVFSEGILGETYGQASVLPKPYKIKDYAVEWRFKNYEPKTNLFLRLDGHNPAALLKRDYFTEKSPAYYRKNRQKEVENYLKIVLEYVEGMPRRKKYKFPVYLEPAEAADKLIRIEKLLTNKGFILGFKDRFDKAVKLLKSTPVSNETGLDNPFSL
jgi:hypothetical protein